MGCIWNLGSWVNWQATGWAGWPNSALCQFLRLLEHPQTKSPASITQLTVHLGRHTQACLTSNINMAKHWDAVGPSSWARAYVREPPPPPFPSQAKIGTEWCFLRAGFTKRVAWSDDRAMDFEVQQIQVRVLNPLLSRGGTLGDSLLLLELWFSSSVKWDLLYHPGKVRLSSPTRMEAP